MESDRRSFLSAGAAALGCAAWSGAARGRQPGGRSYRAAVIGVTGDGGYGHGYETVFRGLPNVSLEAIADVQPEGLRAAAERAGAKRQYLDYREMLAKEKPDLVCVATRSPNYHRQMALAAIEVGAHLIIEKPLAETLEDADAIVKAADASGRKIAMCHPMRFSSDLRRIKWLIEEGFLGTPVEVRGIGAQDGRYGGEDMFVLGTHEFDLMRFYFGDPLWCQASVTVGGRDITREDVRRAHEPFLTAGDSLRAAYGFPGNLVYYWSSVKTPDHWRSRRGFTLFGSQRIIACLSSPPRYYDSPQVPGPDDQGAWRPLPPPQKSIPVPGGGFAGNLIHAIETDTQPLSSGHDGRWAVEMVAAAYQSQRTRARVDFPLQERRNPLKLL